MSHLRREKYGDRFEGAKLVTQTDCEVDLRASNRQVSCSVRESELRCDDHKRIGGDKWEEALAKRYEERTGHGHRDAQKEADKIFEGAEQTAQRTGRVKWN